MTAAEVAEFLHVPVSTVYYLARHGGLSAKRLGRCWRSLRPRLEEFMWSSGAGTFSARECAQCAACWWGRC